MSSYVRRRSCICIINAYDAAASVGGQRPIRAVRLGEISCLARSSSHRKAQLSGTVRKTSITIIYLIAITSFRKKIRKRKSRDRQIFDDLKNLNT